MAKKKIGLIFSYSESWIGGTYYILNFINALNHVGERFKPEIYLYCKNEDEFYAVLKETNYPYLKFIKRKSLSGIVKLINKISRFCFKRNFSSIEGIEQLDLVFPLPLYQKLPKHLKKVFWIPDFQEHYLPEFFSTQEVQARKRNQKYVSKQADILVLSSENAKNDFCKFYPKAKAKPFVLNFAVTQPDFSHISFEQLKQKYVIPKRYFFIANQFFAHKNHITALKAIVKLKQRGIYCNIVMSGKQYDYRNKDNFTSLLEFIKNNNLTNQVYLLGFIPREEQLCLLNNSQAIIQPTLFEGWSTVVEDVKALQKLIIVSNLKVHQEQLTDNALFFEPLNPQQLAEIIQQVSTRPPAIKNFDYSKHIEKFGEDIIKLIHQATNSIA